MPRKNNADFMFVCQDCHRIRPYYAKDRCNSCYNNLRHNINPELKKKHNESAKKKYKEDPEFRRKSSEYHKKYNERPEVIKRRREYQNEYYKKYDYKRFDMTKIGMLCECGFIDKGTFLGRLSLKHRFGLEHKCPGCGKYRKRTKVRFNRKTGEIIKQLE